MDTLYETTTPLNFQVGYAPQKTPTATDPPVEQRLQQYKGYLFIFRRLVDLARRGQLETADYLLDELLTEVRQVFPKAPLVIEIIALRSDLRKAGYDSERWRSLMYADVILSPARNARLHSRGGQPPTIDDFKQHIQPTLEAIHVVQDVIDESRERPTSAHKVIYANQTLPLHVRMQGVQEALELLQRTITPWRRRFAPDLKRIDRLEPGLHRQCVNQLSTRWTITLLKYIAAGLEPERERQYRLRLRPQVEQLALGAFDLPLAR